MARPRPAPPRWRERDASAREKRSNARGELVGHARSVVVHLDDGAPAAVVDPHRDGRAGGRVLERVPDEIAQHLPEPVLVAVDGDARGHVGRHDPVGRDRACVGGGVDAQHAEVDRLTGQRPPLVETGEQQQVVDQRRHPDRLLLGAPHRLVEIGGVTEAAVSVELGVAADRGDRRAQLVGGVGHEPPEPRLRRRPLGERVLDPGHHRVQRNAQLGGLGARPLLRYPLREVTAGDHPRGRGHAFDRSHAEAQHPEHDEAEDRDDHRHRHHEHQPEPAHRRVDVLQGQPHQADGAVGRPRREHAEAARAAEAVDGERLARPDPADGLGHGEARGAGDVGAHGGPQLDRHGPVRGSGRRRAGTARWRRRSAPAGPTPAARRPGRRGCSRWSGR